MRRIRVLIVDDAPAVRRLLADALAAEPDLEVAGTAANGREALERIARLAPDLVVLDLEMPELDGLGVLRALRRDRPRLPVIVFSSLTRHGVATTLDALWLGANDYVTKPAATGLAAARAFARGELAPRIRALCPDAARAVAGPVFRPLVGRPRRAGAVAIAASTGGPRALATLLGGIAPGFPLPILVVQHIPAAFTRSLAERLAAQTGHAVAVARDGAPLRPGEVWIAPGDRHLALAGAGADVRLRLDDGAPENSCRPSANVLFRAVADVYGAGALAVVLTGMGQDGLAGCERVRRRHGQILAQDETSSVVWGMPGQVARAGLADAVLPLGALAGEIGRRVGRARSRRAAA